MRIKVYYRKNLKMSPGKLAAQVAHAVIGLGVTDENCDIVVLEARDKKFFDLCDVTSETELNEYYIHKDKGLTEVAEDEATVVAWIEDK